ncbi:MAG: hypothetical protein IJ097_02060 [Bacilli bacterium]|nr:hypothetical protein [Bacilli bacterium]
MTQKELLYVEDAIGHEKVIISNLEDLINCLSDDNIKNYVQKEIKTHKKMENNLMSLLEDNVNE